MRTDTNKRTGWARAWLTWSGPVIVIDDDCQARRGRIVKRWPNVPGAVVLTDDGERISDHPRYIWPAQ